MIKNHLFLKESIIFASGRLINTSSGLSHKWFYRLKPFFNPPKAYPSFENDWEHQSSFDLNKTKPIDGVTELEEYEKLPDFLKKCYTYEFLSKKSIINKELLDQAANLDVDEFKNPLAYRIVKRTVQIRNCKEYLKKDYKAKMMIKALRSLIRMRQEDLKQLMIENGDLIDRMCKHFKISIVPDEPRKYVPDDPKYKIVKDEAKLIKQKKVKSFREDLVDSKEEFLAKKQKELEEVRQNLSKINLNIEDVLKEVIYERREALLEPIYKEKYGWFETEKELKVLYEKKLAEKKAARERQQRR